VWYSARLSPASRLRRSGAAIPTGTESRYSSQQDSPCCGWSRTLRIPRGAPRMTYATRPSTEPALETSVELSKYEQSRLSLVRTSLSASAELPRAIDTVAEIGARTLDVHCVRIWMFDETTSELHCR